jgi:hypothetical protein
MSDCYLVRLRARVDLEQLKREVVLGFVLSGIALVVGLWRYYMVVGANDAVALALAIAGALGFLLTLALPSAWKLPEAWLGIGLRVVGGALFTILLALVYVALVVPVGWLVRRANGVDPVYSWIHEPRRDMEGWNPKQVFFEANLGHSGKLSLAKRFVSVLAFFAQRGHYFFLPVLVILIALGMVLFFVKSSALAPFIYTLF